MVEESWDVVIVGGGPAGLSAALMLGRARRRVLVIDAGSPRNRFAEHIHGLLGHEGLSPRELLERGRAEAAGYGVVVTDGRVERVEREHDGLRIVDADGAVRRARALIVATGMRDELPDIPGLAERWGTTVLHCPYCHGWEVRDGRLGVLLASPLGLHQAELVRQWSDRVTVFAGGLEELPPETARRLQARGIAIEFAPVVEVVGAGEVVVRLGDGREVGLDAVFTAGTPRPQDEVLAPLGLARSEGPFGSFLTVDPVGRTSDDRVWAIGNVVNPAATVPMSMGAGAVVGGAVNAALVAGEFDAAVRDAAGFPQAVPADFWEERYAGADGVWSGRVNPVLADVAGFLDPGRALDLGCGEGADVVWLAEHGWAATGIDISPTAIDRAIAAGERAGLAAGRARFLVGDLATVPEGRYDLVSASFLHSPVALPREEILRQAADRVAPGGHLLVTSHAAAPPWAREGHPHRFLGPEEELTQLDLDARQWEVVLAETRPREATAPDGTRAALDDVVVLVRRR